MSGRKSTEVNGLLARGKNARDAGNASYEHTFRAAEEILKKNELKIGEINTRLSGEKLQIDAGCRSEFPKEAEQLETSIKKITQANKRVSYQRTLQEFQKSAKKIDAELMKADQESDSIRQRIKNKNWYCDAEYREADALLSRYQNIAQQKNNLSAQLYKAAQDSTQDLIKYENLETLFSNTQEAYKRLQEQANEIRALRSKAKEAKEYINKQFQETDPALAEKFLPDDYRVLADEVKKFGALSDQQAVQQVTIMSETITMFLNRVQQCHVRFLEQKKQAETALHGNRELLSTSKYFYFEPIDYFKNKEHAVKIPLLDYLSAYSDQNEMVRSIEAGIDQIEELIKEENFETACQQADRNTELIQKAAGYAAKKQEHLIENFYVARDIKKVMIDMGFETGATKLGGNIKNGWRITAKNPGGESIDFTQVFIEDDGEVKINIDHKTAGNCSSEWAEICSALDDAGIHIEKIDMENGTNVLNKREGQTVSQTIQESAQAGLASNA